MISLFTGNFSFLGGPFLMPVQIRASDINRSGLGGQCSRNMTDRVMLKEYSHKYSAPGCDCFGCHGE